MKTTKEVIQLAILAMENRARETLKSPGGSLGKIMSNDYKEATKTLKGDMILISKSDAKRITDRLEYDASWDKVGSVYYEMIQHLDEN